MTVEMFLQRLSGVRRNGEGWIARCPAHDDRTPSLSVSEKDGKILFHCHAGCSQEAVLAATGIEKRELFLETSERRIAAEYNYTDEAGQLLSQVLCFEPKSFRQRRPDGNGGWTWNLDGTRRVLYRLPEVLRSQSVLVCEGEKDCETAGKLDLVATCNPGGAGKWRAEYSESLCGKRIAIIADADEPGRKHGQQVAAALAGKAASLRVLGLPGAKDLTEWIEKGGTREQLLAIIHSTAEWAPTEPVAGGEDHNRPRTPWDAAESMESFLGQEEDEIEFLEPRLIAKGCITEMFAPRGLGKSLVAASLAIKLAQAGLRVLLLDRDNPRAIVRKRLQAFGATPELQNLKSLSREKCPPLTNAAAWGAFPYSEYDLIILDSLDSSAEGVGEKDSDKPSRAIAPLLDVAHRENGPAVLVLGNTVKTGAHSRGCGVIEDRADIVFEVRDATSFQPSGRQHWWEELPPADAGSWAAKATRRQRRTMYRLAFIPSKFRIGEEPEPFVLQIDLTNDLWVVLDVTDVVDHEGAEARQATERRRQETEDKAIATLVAEITLRAKTGQPALPKDRGAVPLLKGCGLGRNVARKLLKDRDGVDWRLVPGERGAPTSVLPLNFDALRGVETDEVEHLYIPLEAAKDAGFGEPQVRHPHKQEVAHLSPSEVTANKGFEAAAECAADSIFAPPDVPGKPESPEQEMHTPECSESPSGQAQPLLLDPKVPAEGESGVGSKGDRKSPKVQIEI